MINCLISSFIGCDPILTWHHRGSTYSRVPAEGLTAPFEERLMILPFKFKARTLKAARFIGLSIFFGVKVHKLAV